MRNYMWLIVILLAIGAKTEAQTRLRHISTEDGLSHSTVRRVFQDSRGFMWFSTVDGLNRYDGYDFKVFVFEANADNSIASSLTWDMVEDDSGGLWIATQEGLSHYDPQTGLFDNYRHDPADTNSLSHNYIRSLVLGDDGRLWVGTQNGLNCYDPVKQEFARFRPDSDNPTGLKGHSISALLCDHKGNLWVGTENGVINRLNRQTGEFTSYFSDGSLPGQPVGDSFWVIFEDHRQTIWVGSDEALLRYDPATDTFIAYQSDSDDPNSLSHNSVQTICEDRQGVLWVGTNEGLNSLSADREKFTRYLHDPNNPSSLQPNQIMHLLPDKAGSIWIATYGGGISLYDPKLNFFQHFHQYGIAGRRVTNNYVSAFFEDDDGYLWVGHNKGLDRLDRPTGELVHFGHDAADPTTLGHAQVRAIAEDRQGQLWVGCYGGVSVMDRDRGRFTRYQHDPADTTSLSNNTVRSVKMDQHGQIWIGTYHGLNKYVPETNSFISYTHNPDDPATISHSRVWAILEDAQGRLWLGTRNGINLFHPDDETFTRYTPDPTNPHALSDNDVFVIHQDRQGIFWIGTGEGGLNRFDSQTGLFRTYDRRDGLPDDSVYGILEDSSGDLWCCGNKGIFRFDPALPAAAISGTFKIYTYRDGLQKKPFNVGSYYISPKGEMFFGGADGFNAFFPQDIIENSYIPPVVITGFSIFNTEVAVGPDSPLTRPITVTTDLRLSYKQSVFSFEFAALGYLLPAKNKYAYKLDGFEQDWNFVDASRRHATYTNLDGGNYVFRVKAANNDGIWNDQGAMLRLTIQPPFWQTWWFRTISVLLLMVFAYATYKIRTRVILERNRTLEVRVTERTNELARANQSIRKLNEQLKTENLRMSAELEITRRLQEMILPRQEELDLIEHLDIACYMQPADEVGGDYYDVHQEGNIVRVAIGDVTGHGLESGVVMLMAQTAIRTLINSGIEDGHKFFDSLNKTLYENVKRMKSDKMMSLLLLKYDHPGIQVCGFHEHIIVFRATGEAELIGTKGMWLAIEPDISTYMLHPGIRLNLGPGDGIVLYSDGITEAHFRPADQEPELYGEERLCDLVAQNSSKSAEEIKQTIIADVHQFVGENGYIHDDLTLVILKQK